MTKLLFTLAESVIEAVEPHHLTAEIDCDFMHSNNILVGWP